MFGENSYCSRRGKVDNGADFQLLTKHFYSHDHANRYVQEMQGSRQPEIASKMAPASSMLTLDAISTAYFLR